MHRACTASLCGRLLLPRPSRWNDLVFSAGVRCERENHGERHRRSTQHTHCVRKERRSRLFRRVACNVLPCSVVGIQTAVDRCRADATGEGRVLSFVRTAGGCPESGVADGSTCAPSTGDSERDSERYWRLFDGIRQAIVHAKPIPCLRTRRSPFPFFATQCPIAVEKCSAERLCISRRHLIC